MKFFEELKRRNVIKETIAYIVMAWVFLQVITLVLGIFEAPSWVSKTLLFILAMGLPFWIFFSWAYQVTPEGFKKTEKISEDQASIVASNKRLDILIIITLMIAIAVAFMNKPMDVIATNTVVENDLALNNSIAVLPFDDNSPGKDQEWFTDGMTEALIAELSKISSLIVPSHQTVKKYKGSTQTLPEIARELNVGAIFVGSASKVDDSIRIRAQLLNASDKPLWGESYDEGFGHALQLQHNIARAITKQINIVLTPADSARFTMPAPVDPEALEADLKGIQILLESQEINQTKVGVEYLKRAIEIDSTYALAYAHLAMAYVDYSYYCENTPLESFFLIETPNNMALQLDPQLTLGYLNRFYQLYFIKWEWEEALQVLSKAESLSKNDPIVLINFVYYYITSGKFEKAFDTVERIRQIDPEGGAYFSFKVMTQFHSRDLEGVLKTAEEGLKLFPGASLMLELQMWSFSLMGRHDEAVEVARKILTNDQGLNPIRHGEIGAIFARASLKQEALKQLEIIQGLKLNYIDPVSLGLLYMGLGDLDMAMEYFEKGYEIHAGWMPFLKRGPPFDAMRGDPRFEKLIQNLKFP